VVAFFVWHAVGNDYDCLALHDMSQGGHRVAAVDSRNSLPAGMVILLVAFIDEFSSTCCGNVPRYERPKPKTAEEVVSRRSSGV